MAHGPLGRTRCRPITADRAVQPEGSLVNRDTRSSVECSQSGDTEHVSDAADAGEDQDGRPQHRPSGNRQLPPAPEHQPEQDHGGDQCDLPPKEPPDHVVTASHTTTVDSTTTAFGGVCPGTSQARSSSNKLGMNWSAMQAGQRPQASDAKIPLRQGLFGYPVGSGVTV